MVIYFSKYEPNNKLKIQFYLMTNEVQQGQQK